MSDEKTCGARISASMTNDDGEEVACYELRYKDLPYGVFVEQIEPLIMKAVENVAAEMYAFGMNVYKADKKD